MTTFFLIVTAVVLSTYLLINGIYLVSMGLAARDLTAVGRQLRRSVEPEAFASPLTPGVSVLVPARNEEVAIVDTVHSLLAQRYPKFEVIVIVGGSDDATVDRLVAEFNLTPARLARRAIVRTGPVDSTYLSATYPGLVLLCKPDAGKADALNAGLNAARHPYVATVDGDALLEEDALLGAVQPVLADPGDVVGVGGTVRPVNGCRVERGRVTEVRFPTRTVAAIQVVEYLRTFTVMRTSLSGLNSLLIISGAFGLFRRDLVEDAGGWFTGTAADDVEIVIHIRRLLRERGSAQRIVFVPKPVCWTEVPDTLRELLRQRRRWHRGIAEVLWRHRAVPGRRRYGRLGGMAVPYLLLELIDPPIELLAWFAVILAWMLGILSVPLALAFLGTSFLVNLVISLGALALGEVDYRRHATGAETRRMLLYGLLEIFGYRQLVSAACLLGLVDFLRGHQHYIQPRRRGPARV